MEEEPFNPDYVDVDRVLEVSYCEDKDSGEVKWILFHRRRCTFQHILLFLFSFGDFSEDIFLASAALCVRERPRPS